MPSWRAVCTLTAISVGATALFYTVPDVETFDDWFQEWFMKELWPIIKKQMHGDGGKQNNGNESGNGLVNWVKNTANKATNAIEGGVVFTTMFPDEPQIEDYRIFHIAKVKMYMNSEPPEELIFIGAAGGWALNPLQKALIYAQDLSK